MKACTKCGETKQLTEFSIQGNKVKADGSTYKQYRARCKLCLKEKVQQYGKTYLAKHGDEIRARNREKWRLDNPPKEPKPKRTAEEMREYQRRYYLEHREKYKEYSRQYYQDNKEKLNEYVKEWQKENRERYMETRKAYQTANREKINAQQKAHAAKLFAKNPEKVRAARRAKKALMKAKDPAAWNAKAAKYNRPVQRKMVAELSDAYVRQRLTRENDDGPRKISARDIPQALVEAKRLQLMILRSLKNEKHN